MGQERERDGTESVHEEEKCQGKKMEKKRNTRAKEGTRSRKRIARGGRG